MTVFNFRPASIRRHDPLGELSGGPLDGGLAVVGQLGGEPPDELRDSRCPYGGYVLLRVVRHDDGSLCGGLYRYREDSPGERCRCRQGVDPGCPLHAEGWRDR